MKKYLLIFFMMMGSFSGIMAQDGGGETRADKIQALKTAFITQKLQLTPDEAQKFWPVYNQYENEMRSIRLDDKDPDVIERDQKLIDIRKKYVNSFEKILGKPRVNKLFNAERDFRAILIQQLKNRNQQRLGGMRR